MLPQSKAGPTSKSSWAMQTRLGGREKKIESWVSRGVEGKRENVEERIRSKYFIGNSQIINKNITFLEEWDLARDKRALLPVGNPPPVAPMLIGPQHI